jgi:mRNA interferase YafQ
MYTLILSNKFKKSLKKLSKNSIFKKSELDYVIKKLVFNIPLEVKYKDHKLQGEYVGYRECHIQNDILLIYFYEKDVLVLTLVEIGSHSDLF